MLQFIQGTTRAFEDLEARATEACIVFRRERLPPGSLPAHADVAFEVHASTGESKLQVEGGCNNEDGRVPQSVREWLHTGEIAFPSFAQLVRFIRSDLAQAYGVRQDLVPSIVPRAGREPGPPPVSPRNLGPAPRTRLEELTDFEAVNKHATADNVDAGVEATILFEELKHRVRGQDRALHALADGVARHVSRTAPRRPATFMAIGPTGVGKTLAAESLRDALFEASAGRHDYGFLRVDLSEMQEEHRVSQLLGAPPGYVGYGEGTPIVEVLQARPRSIILLDEAEKAHPAVMRTLMNVMDAGRLSPSTGRHGEPVDCRQAILLFTSNLDSSAIVRKVDAQADLEDHAVSELCRKHLRDAGVAPEIAGRIQSFLVFKLIAGTARAEIFALAVCRVAEEYGVQVQRIEPLALATLMTEAGVKDFGVRSVEHALDGLIGPALLDARRRAKVSGAVLHGPPYEFR